MEVRVTGAAPSAFRCAPLLRAAAPPALSIGVGVFSLTTERLATRSIAPTLLPESADLYRPEDLPRWTRLLA